jgi:hypothetical protein
MPRHAITAILPPIGAIPAEAAMGALNLEIPKALDAEHAELHRDLKAVIGAGGRTGQAAEEVADALHTHFEREEELALPPLALLAPLAAGERASEFTQILALTDRLRVELPRMLDEHKVIAARLERLITVANEEGRNDAATFARRLMQHAAIEEQVTYPAAILVGEFVKARLRTG